MMINDEYIAVCLHIPITMILLLAVMIYFHRHHMLKYLYLANIFCYLASVFSYFGLRDYEVGEGFPMLWMNALPFIWLIGTFAAYVLALSSVSAFVIEHAQRHLWAKIVLWIAALTFIVLCIIGMYFFIQGIQSLKSG